MATIDRTAKGQRLAIYDLADKEQAIALIFSNSTSLNKLVVSIPAEDAMLMRYALQTINTIRITLGDSAAEAAKDVLTRAIIAKNVTIEP